MSAFEEGHKNAPICILAEAPGSYEIRTDRPLVGSSGVEFNGWLSEAGLARSDCYILNVWETQVYKDEEGGKRRSDKISDKYGRILWGAKRGHHFTDEGLVAAQNTIRRLEQCSANVIVPLGGVALSLLYSDSRITKWRGSILEAKRFPGRKIVGTFHPQFVLRGNYPHKYTCVSDIKRVIEESQDPGISLPRRNLIVDPSFNDVIGFLEYVRDELESVACDIEVLNHQISCLCFADSPAQSLCIPLLDGTASKPRWTDEQEARIWLLVAAIIGHPEITKINQNLMFDLWVLYRKNNIIPRGPSADCMVAHSIIYPDFPKGLDFLASVHTREPYYKDDGKIWRTPQRDPIKFWRYNALDGAVAYECWQVLEPQLRSEGYWNSYAETVELFDPLMFAMTKGIKMDRDGMRTVQERVKGKQADLQAELDLIVGHPLNVSSPKQCQEYFYVTKNINPYYSSKTRAVTTDDSAMARIYKRHGLREAKIIQEIRSLRKLDGTYLSVSFDVDDRLRCSYNIRGTTTFRLSSSETIEDTGTNMQNLVPEVKDFLVPDREV